MRKIDKAELQDIQLNILVAVDSLCRQHNIRYSIACGTLLGAVRHGGYIPWDDDIDIYMLRSDFERFESIFPAQYENYYEFSSLARDKNWCLPFGKVYDNRTQVFELRSRIKTPGVNIDIFPIDEVPDDNLEWKFYNDKRKSYIRDLRHSLLTCSKLNSFVKNCGALYYFVRFLFSSPRHLAEKCNNYAQIHNGAGYKRVFETSLGMTAQQPFDKILFNHISEINFENKEFQCFEAYNEYLFRTFGDYMTLPPVEKRISEHTYNAFWKE